MFASCHGLSHSERAQDIDGAILQEGDTTKAGKELIFPGEGPSPRVEMSYAYLMAWFVLHCPVLIQPREEAPEGIHFALLHCLKNSQWEGKYLAGVQRLASIKIHIVCSGAFHIS